jgi:hypothetical protein
VHELGAVDCGPKTVKVIVPPDPLVEPASSPSGWMPTPAASVDGALTVNLVAAVLTVVEGMFAPHLLAMGLSLASPP